MLALKMKLSTLLEQLNEHNVMNVLNLIYNPLIATDSSSEFSNVTCDINYLLDAVFFKPVRGVTIEVASGAYLENKTIEQAQIDTLVDGFHNPDLWDNLLEYKLYLVSPRERERVTKLYGFEETAATKEEEAEMYDFIVSLNLEQASCTILKIN